jgi:glycosyltransferase involved in cell wall biosynthesis
VFEEIKKKYPTARLNLINAHLDDRSTIYKGKCIKLIEEKGLSDSIFWTSEFLSYDEIQAQLSSSDLIILPYRESTESSSGAVRICMTSQIPILVSTSSIFSDVANVVLQSDVHNLFEFTKKAFEILENSEIRFKAIESQNNFMNSYSFKKMSEKLFNIIQASISSSSN